MLAPNILTIRDETAMGDILYELQLPVTQPQISVRDIIIKRVNHEVEVYNNKIKERYYGLVQPSQAEQKLNGFKLNSKAKIKVDTQIEIALLSFESNGFFMLFDDLQAEDLEQMVNLDELQTVSFVKLTPLVGG